jgi:hypothetical protein
MTLPSVEYRRGATAAWRHAWIWRAREHSLDARTGQTGTFLRASAKAVADSFGVNRTVNHSQPAWRGVDLDLDSTSESIALALGATEGVSWPVPVLPRAMSGLVDFIQNQAITPTSAILALCSGAAANPLLMIESTGAQYRIRHHNGTSAVSSTMTGTAPTSGQRVRLRFSIDATGTVQIWQSVALGAEVAATASGALTLGAAWSGTPTLWLNSAGTTQYGDSFFLGGVLMLGANVAQATLLEALA